MKYEDWLRNKDLEYKNGILNIANVSTIELAEKFGTPIYVVNEQMIRKRYQKLKQVLDSEYKNNSIHFAMKSNSSLSVEYILKFDRFFVNCIKTLRTAPLVIAG